MTKERKHEIDLTNVASHLHYCSRSHRLNDTLNAQGQKISRLTVLICILFAGLLGMLAWSAYSKMPIRHAPKCDPDGWVNTSSGKVCVKFRWSDNASFTGAPSGASGGSDS